MRELIFNAICIGSFSWVYHVVLRADLLSEWFFWAWKKFDNFNKPQKWYIRLWYRPIFECERCFAGQLALWSYFFLTDNYHFITHITYISFSILSVALITKWTKSEV